MDYSLMPGVMLSGVCFGALSFESSQDGNYWNSLPEWLRIHLARLAPAGWSVAGKELRCVLFDTSSLSPLQVDELHRRIWSLDRIPLVVMLHEGRYTYYNGYVYEPERRRLRMVTFEGEPGRVSSRELMTYYLGCRRAEVQAMRVSALLTVELQRMRDRMTATFDRDSVVGRSVRAWLGNLLFIAWLSDLGFVPALRSATRLARRTTLGRIADDPEKTLRLFRMADRKLKGAMLRMELMPSAGWLYAGEELPQESALWRECPVWREADLSLLAPEMYGALMRALELDAAAGIPMPHQPEEPAAQLHACGLQGHIATMGTRGCVVFDPTVRSATFLCHAFGLMIDRELAIVPDCCGDAWTRWLSRVAESNLFGTSTDAVGLRVANLSVLLVLFSRLRTKNWPFLPQLLKSNLVEGSLAKGDMAAQRLAQRHRVLFFTGLAAEEAKPLVSVLQAYMGRQTTASLLINDGGIHYLGRGAAMFRELLKHQYRLSRLCEPLSPRSAGEEMGYGTLFKLVFHRREAVAATPAADRFQEDSPILLEFIC